MTWSESNAGKNLLLLRVASIFGSLDFSRSLFVVYLVQAGLSNTQIGVLQALLFWSTFALEIPSGIFADTFRRKFSVIVSCSLTVAMFFLFPFAKSFLALTGVFFLWGASFAFMSGAKSALLYDGLKEAGPKWLSGHLSEMALQRSLSSFAIVGAMIAGGFLFSVNPQLIFWMSGFAALVTLIVYLYVSEAPRRKHNGEGSPSVTRSLADFLKGSRGKNLLWLLIGMALIEACHTPIFVFSQSLLTSLGVSGKGVSIFVTANFLTTAIFLRYAQRLKAVPLPRLIFTSIAILIGLLVCIALVQSLALIVIALALFNLVPHMLFVFSDQYFQDQCDSSFRASFLSVQSFVSSIAIGISYMGLGVVSDLVGVRNGVVALILLLMIAAFFVRQHFVALKGICAVKAA
jgi:MFS family permease